MKYIIMIFNFLIIPIVSVYMYSKMKDKQIKLSVKLLINYIMIVGIVGVAAKATAVCIANSFIIVIFHYQPAYAAIVLMWAVIVPYVYELFMRNIKYVINKKKDAEGNL